MANKVDDIKNDMKELHITQPTVLDNLMKYHFYIDYHGSDREKIGSLTSEIGSKKLTYLLRSNLTVKEQSILDNIKQGVAFSHKCILYISQQYLEDSNSKQAIELLKRKLKFLGQKSVIGFVEDSVKAEDLRECEQFSLIRLNGQTSLTAETLNQHRDLLLDFELNPNISTMPKQSTGVGVAQTYIFGYLQMVLPDIRKTLEKELIGKERNGKAISPNDIVKKFLIVIPETVRSSPELKEEGVFQQKYLVKQVANRAGFKGREYTVPVYELIADNDVAYYFPLNVPACLFAIREAKDDGIAQMTEDELYEARNEFVLALKAYLSHHEKEHLYANQWEILIWPDDEKNPKYQKLSSFLCEQIVSKRLTEVADTSVSNKTHTVQPTDDGKTYQKFLGIRHYPMYSDGLCYTLKPCGVGHEARRGLCIIINNFRFAPESGLSERTGAASEIDNLRKLWEKLKFKVVMYENLNAEYMKDRLVFSQSQVDPADDAFVCCIMSHGENGEISGADGNKMPVMNLMKLFFDEFCPQLKGKPKLFFIGSCQGKGNESSDPRFLQHMSHPEGIASYAELIPSNNDFIVSYATLPDKVSWADRTSGGLYVDALVKFLQCDLEIDIALRNVDTEVGNQLEKRAKEDHVEYSSQCPWHVVMPPHKYLFLGSDI